MNSGHKVEIVPVELHPHGNADALSVIPVFGYTYVGRTADWLGKTRAAYIPPDSVVDATRPEFQFLLDQAKDGKVRIKARRLRGVVSFGLMVPVPDDTPLGEDWAERLGVEHYEPPIYSGNGKAGASYTGGESVTGPDIITSRYELEHFRRYHSLFEPGEPIVVSEKLDGCNSRYVFFDGEMYCGSRTEWKREYPLPPTVTVEELLAKGLSQEAAEAAIEKIRSKPLRRNMWWEALSRTPQLEAFCRANPGTVVYGEVFGNVNCIKYGLANDQFAAFDVLEKGRWLDPHEARERLHGAGVPLVPLLNPVYESGLPLGIYPPHIITIPYDFDTICEMAEGKTLVPGAKAGTIREGVVVSPMKERYDARLGRIKMKVVSAAFLERYR